MNSNFEKIQIAKEQLATENVSNFPSFFQMARNAAKQAWLSGKGAILGEGFLATAEKAFNRLEICKTCEFYRDTRCLKCGCFMEAKAQLEAATCPANKWGESTMVISKVPTTPTREIDISNYPENERSEIMELAEDALLYDGRFSYKKIHYKASKRNDGTIKIDFFIKKSHHVNRFNESEAKEFTKLVEEKKKLDDSADRTFIFKSHQYTVSKREDGGWNIGSEPLTTNLE